MDVRLPQRVSMVRKQLLTRCENSSQIWNAQKHLLNLLVKLMEKINNSFLIIVRIKKKGLHRFKHLFHESETSAESFGGKKTTIN